MKSKTKTIKNLTPHDKNPRVISDDSKDGLKASLSKFGDLGGLVYNRKSKKLISGHQRRDALINLSKTDLNIGITKEYKKPTANGTVAVGYFDFNGEPFSYREVNWDENTEIEALIAANNIHNFGKFDDDTLGALLDSISFDSEDYNVLNLHKLESFNLDDGDENGPDEGTPPDYGDIAPAIKTDKLPDEPNQEEEYLVLTIRMSKEIFKLWKQLLDRTSKQIGYKSETKTFEFAVIEALNTPEESQL